MQNTMALVVGTAIVLGLYFVPSIVALYRKHENAGRIFLLNLLAGWTLLGWGVAFVWAEGAGVPRDAALAEEGARKRAA